MPQNPLVEVFGYPVGNMSALAIDHRKGRLCPYHNPSGPHCTKTSVEDPLGVCSILDKGRPVITCPVRFPQDLLFLSDAARFFFPDGPYISVAEARLKDRGGKSAGNIDVVMAQLDERGRVADFGAVETQAVYITGNVRKVFREYMSNPEANSRMTWPTKNYPGPDYLSSSRKRLAPQLIFKGGILHAWGKKTAVVVQHDFFDQLPELAIVGKDEAEIAWLIYDLRHNAMVDRYDLYRHAHVYTKFESALSAITTPGVGDMNVFVKYIEGRIKSGKASAQPLSTPVEPTVEPLSDALSLNDETDMRDTDGDRC